MKNLSMAVLVSLVWTSGAAVAQEHKHEAPKPEQKAPAKSDAMKCCEGMEKMGEMKSGMPMKGEMTPEMKGKMMENMKAKMADKVPEKKSPDVPAKGQAEKSQPHTDGHKH